MGKDLQNKDLRMLLDAIVAERIRRNPPDPNGWTRGVQGDPRYRLHNGAVVAMVRRFKTHTKTNNGVYEIIVLDEMLPDQPRHVETARVIVDQALSEHFGEAAS